MFSPPTVVDNRSISNANTYTRTHTHIRLHIHIHICAYVCLSVRECVCVCVSVCLSVVRLSVYRCVCPSARPSDCRCICMCVCVCVHAAHVIETFVKRTTFCWPVARCHINDVIKTRMTSLQHGPVIKYAKTYHFEAGLSVLRHTATSQSYFKHSLHGATSLSYLDQLLLTTCSLRQQ